MLGKQPEVQVAVDTKELRKLHGFLRHVYKHYQEQAFIKVDKEVINSLCAKIHLVCPSDPQFKIGITQFANLAYYLLNLISLTKVYEEHSISTSFLMETLL